MSKLFELLAVEGDLRKKAAEATKQAASLFGQPGRFTGQTVSAHVILEGEPELFPESTDVASTVDGELAALAAVFGDYVDVTVQKELTNTGAFADVEIDGAKFLSGLSATALLNLENRIEELFAVYHAIPTLDTVEHWQVDAQRGGFRSDVRSAYRNKKVPRPLVLSEATKEHPAQVQVYTDEIPAYKIEKVIFSGMLTPSDKAERLERLSVLATAVKKARQRANDVEIKPVAVAKKIFDYINGKAK